MAAMPSTLMFTPLAYAEPKENPRENLPQGFRGRQRKHVSNRPRGTYRFALVDANDPFEDPHFVGPVVQVNGRSKNELLDALAAALIIAGDRLVVCLPHAPMRREGRIA